MRYLNFDIDAFDYTDRDSCESFSVRVSQSPVGEQKIAAAERVQLPIEARTQHRLLDRRGLDIDGMMRFGALLGQALLPPPVRRMFEASRARLGSDQGLRLRLRLDHFALANLPWEYLYLGDASDRASADITGFAALDRQLSIVRYELLNRSNASASPPARASDALRFIALLSSPASLEPLRLDREEAMIRRSLDAVPMIQQEYAPKARLEDLLDLLAQPADILHFAGHGIFQQKAGGASGTYGSREGAGYIVLEDESGKASAVPAERLALLLQNRGVRLAVLGACQTGTRDSVNPWTGVATALVRAGIPAVIGMQFKVLDVNNIAFNRQFYQALAQGNEIDFAVNAGRLAMLARAGDDDRDWGVPVLYMRSDNGVLFPASRAAEPEWEPQPYTIRRRYSDDAPVLPSPLFRQAAAALLPPAPLPEDPTQLKVSLRDILNTRFNMADLEVLCHTLGVDFEQIVGESRLRKALSLVEYMGRRARLLDLVSAIRAQRPGAL